MGAGGGRQEGVKIETSVIVSTIKIKKKIMVTGRVRHTRMLVIPFTQKVFFYKKDKTR